MNEILKRYMQQNSMNRIYFDASNKKNKFCGYS